jgi:DNA-binding CsgD family transcriptional regulator
MTDSRGRFVRLAHRGLDLRGYFDAADRVLAELLPFDSSCWLSLDPGMGLPTSHFSQQFGSDHLIALAANEFLEDDVNKFSELSRARRPVGILSQTTHGDPWLSARFVGVLEPQGYGAGDELRAVFRDGPVVWGCAAFHRRRGSFEDREADLVADVGGYIAVGIRRAILRTALALGADPDPPGLIVLRADDSVESLTPAGSHWLAEIFDSTSDSAVVPLTVRSVAHQARRAADGGTDVASVRLPMRAGGWLRMDASLLDADPQGRVAVIVHPAHQPEVASLIVEAYDLSVREREVTRLVLHGRSTQEIANLLAVSPYTVQDHLKSIFAKVGVRSRRELVAQLFLQHCAPRLEDGTGVAADGWFATERVAASVSTLTESSARS